MSSIVAVFSGFRNDNLKTDIQTQLNGKVVSALSTQCNLLVYKKTSKGSTKLDEAAALGIDTITLDDFLAKHKLTLTPDQKEPKKSKKTEGSVVESDPEPTVEPVPEPEVKPKKTVKKASKKEPVVEKVVEAEAEPEQVVAEAEPEPEPEPEPEVKKKVVKKSKKPEPEPEIQPVSEPEPEPKAKKVIKKKAEPEPEPEIQETKPEPKAKKTVKPKKKTEHLADNLVADPIDTKAEKIEKIKLQISALQEELSKLEE